MAHGRGRQVVLCMRWAMLCKASRRGGQEDVDDFCYTYTRGLGLHTDLSSFRHAEMAEEGHRERHRKKGVLELVVVVSVWEVTRRDWDEIQAKPFCATVFVNIVQQPSLWLGVWLSLDDGRVGKRRGAHTSTACDLFTFISLLSSSIHMPIAVCRISLTLRLTRRCRTSLLDPFFVPVRLACRVVRRDACMELPCLSAFIRFTCLYASSVFSNDRQ
ncbi:hypothetical protein B0H65DRAFT_221767 [Neurospora tetraspora]|uniref:Uncharacterized protein n=1 Tax=Neurospora tetraspora TaxID=94610 RepID=A0AAE0JCV7_9PEZI|nr:hypothetical protein B0H65DRAFT_221767 [Neurospora tetraspora]